MSKNTRSATLEEMLESISSISLIDLLKLKACSSAINGAVLLKVQDRLTELVSAVTQEEATVTWEDVSVSTGGDVITINGLRMFSIGDVVTHEGLDIEITEDNVDDAGVSIRMMFGPDTLLRIADPKIPIAQIVEELKTPVVPLPIKRVAQTTSATTAHPLSDDPSSQWLYTRYNTSSTKH